MTRLAIDVDRQYWQEVMQHYAVSLGHINTPEPLRDVFNEIADTLLRIDEAVIYPSDEFYLNSGRDLHGDEFYEDYAQLENGVGMVSLLESEFLSAVEESDGGAESYSASIACGTSIAPILKKLLDRAQKKWHNANWKVYPIVNHFFGEKITVSGLITGHDLIEQLRGKELGERLLISCSMLDSSGEVFLDDLTLEDVQSELNVPVTAVNSDGYELLDALRGIQ